MKPLNSVISLIITLVFFQLSLIAQDDKHRSALVEGPDLRIEQRQVSWLRNDYTAHTMLMHADQKAVEKAFEKFMKDRYKLKFSNARGWREHPDVLITDIISEIIIFAYSTDNEPNGSRLRVIADLGGTSINARDYPQAAANLERIMTTFAQGFYASAYADAIDEEKKELKSADGELSKLKKANQKSEKSKKKAEKSIAKHEKDLKKLRSEVDEAEKEMATNAKKIAEQEKSVKERGQRVDRLRKGADQMRR